MTDKILEAVKALGGDIDNVDNTIRPMIAENLSHGYDGDILLSHENDGRYLLFMYKNMCDNYICTISEFKAVAAEWLKEAYMHNAALDLEWDVANAREHVASDKYLVIYKDRHVTRQRLDTSPSRCPYTPISTTQEFIDYCNANKPCEEVKPEWDGEGLPPVGCECEVEYPAGNWSYCKYMGKGLDGMSVVSYVGGDASCLGRAVKFRPIKSPRDKAIESMIGEYPVGDRASYEVAYDWLKQITPEQKKEFGL